MKIITITLNPAFDVHYKVPGLKLLKQSYATEVVKHAGGKGVNISRTLSFNGVENVSVCVLAVGGGDEFLNSLKGDNLNCIPIYTDGRIRENITLHSNDGETRISCEGFAINKEILTSVLKSIEKEMQKDTIVTFTGRLNDGITNCDAIELLQKIKKLGAKLIVDCNSFTADDLIKIKPYLIKPNEQEISELLGAELNSVNDVCEIAKKLVSDGVENVIISLGAKGFVFCNKNCLKLVNVPKITPVSTIGAGDSTIAGFIAGMASSMEIDNVLKLSAAFGTAACLAEGTNPPDKTDIERIYKDVRVTNINFKK